MNSIMLGVDDLEIITKFAKDFKHEVVEVVHDNSSGIGFVIIARLNEVELNGYTVTIEKVISSSENW